MATIAASPTKMPSRPTYSCIRCADRKVKCDRQRPCSACVKHNADCLFHASQPPQKKKRRSIKHQILTDRLKHYEALLQKQGIEPSKLSESPETGPSERIIKPQVIHRQGRFKFVDNSLWTRVAEEYYDSGDALDGCSDDTSDLEESDDNDCDFVLTNQPKPNIKSLHPPPEQIHQLWQLFIENVDPLTKVVHVPTLRPAIQRAADSIGTIPRSFEALMFAIYSTAIVSLKDDECMQRLGKPRGNLLSRYVSATKAALSRAKFMGTVSLVVLQALVLHIISVRDVYEPRVVWSLTGVAVRIAQGMGLERDGVFLGLPPFETEMRRRIWWLLKTHDFRTAELCGLAKFRDMDTGAESSKWPTNVNDDQLYPGMPSHVAESNTVTDMVFIAMKHELTKLAASRITRFRQQGKDPNQFEFHACHASGSDKVEMDEACKEVENTLEARYLRYCDPSQPLHLLTMLMVRFSMNIVRFGTHHPRRWASIGQTPLSERQWIWEISIKLLEQQVMLLSNPQLKQFAWQAPYFQQWHVFIHILDTLQANPLRSNAEKAWQLIGTVYENNSDMIFDTRKPIHVAVGNLCLKAYSDREAAVYNDKLYFPPAPEFIVQLRHQREIAKTKRQARDAKSGRPENLFSHGQTRAGDKSPTMDAGVSDLKDILESADLQQINTSHPPSLAPTSGTGEGDTFWLNNGFDDSSLGYVDDLMNMDLDLMLAQNHIVEDNAAQTIDWEQWDTWLADSNAMRPLSTAHDTGPAT